MELPTLGQPQNQNYYPQPNQPASKRRLLIIGGVVTILVLGLILLLFGKQPKPGEPEMQASLKSTSEALGIVDTYAAKLQYSQTKNQVALVQILLRGNFQKLNELYKTTYNGKKKFSTSPKPDASSKTELDAAIRNNTLDSEIVTVLEPKINQAQKKLVVARQKFNKSSSVETIEVSIKDLGSIQEILNQAQ